MTSINIYPTVVIGIGGTGKLVCKFLKRNFAERFPQEWINPSTGLPHIIDIKVIETEPGKEKEEFQLPPLPDVHTISAHVDGKALKAMQQKQFLNNNPQIKEWLIPPLPITEIIGGAGQIRQAGRLAFFQHRLAYSKVKRVITTAVNSVRSDEAINLSAQLSKGEISVPDRTPRCYIIGSLCGGTGSGMLLDIAGIVKKLGPRTSLIAFLPKMFEAVIDLPQSIWQLYANTYATIKEINHYMTGGKWEVWYDSVKKDGIKLEEKIFDYCFLVEKESPIIDLKDRLHISPLVGEFLFWMVTMLAHPLYTSDVNIRPFVEAQTPHWCNGLGISSISFPLEDIREVMVNWGSKEFITGHISENFNKNEIDDLIINPNTGYFYNEFNYKNWEDTLLNKNQYSPHSAETIVRNSKGTLSNKIQDEKNRLQKEFNGDIKKMRDSRDAYLEIIKNKLIALIDNLLTSKGLVFYSTFLNRFEEELNAVKIMMETEQQISKKDIEQLQGNLDTRIKWLAKIGKKKWFLEIGWSKRVKPHVENVLRVIKRYFEMSLQAEKRKNTLEIIKEISNLIDLMKKNHGNLNSKLNNLRTRLELEEKKLWDSLTFGSDAQIKIKSGHKDVERFFEDSLKMYLSNIGTILRKRLVDWRGFSEEQILEEIESEINKKISQSGFDNMTILDAMKEKKNMEILGNTLQDSITNKSSPFIRHTGQETVESRFLISGLQQKDFAQLPQIPDDIIRATPFEKANRRIVSLRISANFSVKDLAPYDFGDNYAEAYQESLEKGNKWIHILPEAIGFEDPLGLSGVEEESLIKTCQDVGIIVETGSHHFAYIEAKKRIVIAQGLENAIKKLQDDPNYVDILKSKLLAFFNNQSQGWIHEYIKDHERSSFSSEKSYRENHEHKYTNKNIKCPYPLPAHNIPSYILGELQKRVAK